MRMERWVTLQSDHNPPSREQRRHERLWADLAQEEVCREFGEYVRSWDGISAFELWDGV